MVPWPSPSIYARVSITHTLNTHTLNSTKFLLSSGVKSHDLNGPAGILCECDSWHASQLFNSIHSPAHTYPSQPIRTQHTHTHYTHGRNIRPKSSTESRRGAVKLSPSVFTSPNFLPLLPARSCCRLRNSASYFLYVRLRLLVTVRFGS